MNALIKIRYVVCAGLMGWHVLAWEPLEMVRLTEPAPECVCDIRVNDKFETPLKYGFGKYKGHCVDSCRFRQSKKLSDFGDRRVISNFRHDGKFWNAEIPMDGVEKIDVVFERFAPKISHVFLRFRFAIDKPVILKSQTGPESIRIHDLAISPEGLPPATGEYSMVDGLMNEYLLGFRVISPTDFYERAFVELRHPISQYRLDLKDAKERRRILTAGLEASDSRSLNQIYNLLSNNCATSVMQLINGEKEKDIEGGLPLDLFYGTLSHLRRSGLLSGGAHGSGLPNLEQEMNL